MTATYPALLASGVSNIGRFDQFDLFAGEDDTVTNTAQAADGQAIRQFEVLTFDDDGRLIPWGATGEHATATLTFTGQPTAADTVTINGVVIDFVATLTAGDDDEVLIGTADTDTVANLVALINGVPDSTDPNTLLPIYGIPPLAGTGVTATVDDTGLIVTLHAIVAGTAGNALTIAESTNNMTASSAFTGAEADHASGTLTFGAIAVNNQTITINGNVVTWKTSGAATDGSEANIGASATDSAQNLKVVINDFPGLFGVTADGDAAVLALTAISEGAAGNLITLAKSNTVPTLSGATLTGGGTGEVDSSRRPVGVAMQPVAAATPGVYLPYAEGGVFNHQVLIWPDSVATLAQRRRAVANSKMSIGQLL
jgi:hypothetical protein